MVGQVGRRIDELPYVDARLPDGSRINAVIAPLCVNGGPYLTVRKFAPDPYQADDLVTFGTMSAKVAKFLSRAVNGRLNVLVSGGAGAGKTTTLNVLSSWLPAPSASSPSRTPPSSSCANRTGCGWSTGRPTSRAGARSASATWSATPCGCGRTGSSSARSAAARPSTCCRP